MDNKNVIKHNNSIIEETLEAHVIDIFIENTQAAYCQFSK